MQNATLNTSAIFERLKEFLSLRNDAELAREMGEPPNKLSVWKTRNSVPFEELLSFCRWKRLRFEWALTGDGEPQQGEDGLATYDNEQYKEVGVYALAGAGPARDLVEHEPIARLIVPRSFWKPSIVAIRVKGKSMEPVICDGAFVGIDRDDRAIVSGEVYAVWIPYEGAVVKRILLDTEKIIFRSYNPSHPDFSIPLSDGIPDMILGRVKWVQQWL